jgi:hypothetical protein
MGAFEKWFGPRPPTDCYGGNEAIEKYRRQPWAKSAGVWAASGEAMNETICIAVRPAATAFLD